MGTMKKILIVVACFSVVCRDIVVSLEMPVITRDTYDLLRYPSCNGRSPVNFDCGRVAEFSQRTGDNQTCSCRCKSGHPTYRNPLIKHLGSGKYGPDTGRIGCSWYALYVEECRSLRSVENETHDGNLFPRPIIIDLTQNGNMTLKVLNPFPDPGCFKVIPYVRMPAKNWTRINAKFDLKQSTGSEDHYVLKWESNSSDVYAYQGLVMKLDFFGCGQGSNNFECIMTKVAGTYSDDNDCRRRTIDGRCCIFPFEHEGVLYKDCTTTADMTGPWCAVGLNTTVTKGNHKWRALCADPPSTTASPTPRTSTDSPSSPFPDTSPETSTDVSSTESSSTSFTNPDVSSTKMTSQPIASEESSTQKPIIKWSVSHVPTTVTVTAFVPCKSVATPVDPSARESGGSSGSNVGLVVGVAMGLLILFGAILILVVCIRRRKKTSIPIGKKTLSNEVLAEETPYASIKGTPPHTRKLTNHGFQESIEMSDDKAAVIRKKFLAYNGTTASSHFYDSVAETKPTDASSPTPPSAIYNIPEADYSLIMTPPQQLRVGPRLTPSTDDPAKHLYSALERDNDPLQNPEPIDNDKVFVEANPLYGSSNSPNTNQTHPDIAGRIYDEPSEIMAPKNIYDNIQEMDV